MEEKEIENKEEKENNTEDLDNISDKEKDIKKIEKKEKFKNLKEKAVNIKFNIIEVVIIMIVCILFGVIIGKITLKNVTTYDNEMNQVFDTLLKEYDGKVNKNELEQAAIKGMMEYLDEYSNYFNEEETEDFNEQLKGSFKGLGVEITKNIDNKIEIITVFDNSPAKENGFEEGDIIISINGETVEGKELTDITKMIKNKDNIKIEIERNNERQIKEIDLRMVNIPSVDSKVFEESNKKIGYILISIFAENTDEQFASALKDLQEKNIDSLIIDVRSNTGGHLDTVTNMLELLLDKGQVMYQIQDSNIKEKEYSKNDSLYDYPIVILTDNFSASASEILTSSLKENINATIVGTKTYGKGTVQKTVPLSDGSMIKYTTSKWLTPNGKSIDGVGINPDIEVKLDINYFKTYDDKDDNQLQKAIEVLTNTI